MALNLNIVPTRSLNGQTVYFSDYTGIYDAILNPGGYNGPNIGIASVTGTRFLFNSFLLQQAATSSTVIVANVQYQVGGTGSFVWDTKTYSVGDTFISMLSGTPTLGSCTLTQTGVYSPVVDFLPTDVQTGDFTPSLFGINDLAFPDSTYSVLYEIYTTKYTSGTVPAGTYLVGGVVGATVTINSITYRVGEVFTTGSSHTMTGAGFLSTYATSTLDIDGNVSPHYFLMNYTAFTAIQQLELFIAQTKYSCNTNLGAVLALATDKMQAIYINFQDDLGLNFSGTQALLDDIVNLIATEFNVVNV